MLLVYSEVYHHLLLVYSEMEDSRDLVQPSQEIPGTDPGIFCMVNVCSASAAGLHGLPISISSLERGTTEQKQQKQPDCAPAET